MSLVVNHRGNACGVTSLIPFFLSCLGLTWCFTHASQHLCARGGTLSNATNNVDRCREVRRTVVSVTCPRMESFTPRWEEKLCAGGGSEVLTPNHLLMDMIQPPFQSSSLRWTWMWCSFKILLSALHLEAATLGPLMFRLWLLFLHLLETCCFPLSLLGMFPDLPAVWWHPVCSVTGGVGQTAVIVLYLQFTLLRKHIAAILYK